MVFMNIKYLKKNKLLLYLFSIFFVLFYYYPSFLTGSIILSTYIIYLIYNVQLGILVILFTIPFDIFMRENMSLILLGLNPTVMFLALFVVVYILKLLIERKKIITEKPTIVFILVFLSLNFLALLLNSSQIPLIFSHYGMLLTSLLLLFFYIEYSINSREFFFLFIHALILLSFTVSIVLLPDIFEILYGDILRLNISGSIRNLTNITAPSTLIILYILNSRKLYTEEYTKIFQSKIFLNLIMLLGLFTLILSGSRGTVYALLVAYIALILLNYRISLMKIIFIILIISISITFSFENINLPNPVERLLSTENDIRMEIWRNSFYQVNLQEIIFGRGLNRFQELSRAGGFVATHTGEAWYAHSIYLDILFSAGIISLFCFLMYMIYRFKESFKNKSRLGLVLMVYLSILYFTHGQATSINFWVTLAFVVGAEKWFKNDIKTIVRRRSKLDEKSTFNKQRRFR